MALPKTKVLIASIYAFTKRYRLLCGSLISLGLSLMMLPGGLLLMGEQEMTNLLIFRVVVFLMGQLSWISSGIIADYHEITSKWIKIVIGILVCVLLSFALYKLSRSGGFPAHSEHLLFSGVFFSGFMMLMAVFFFESNKQVENAKNEAEQMRQKNLLSQLNSLREEVNPHFLFNSLNVLKSGAQEKWVKDYAMQLSKVYRYLLNHSNKAHLTLIVHELEFIEAYIHILKERFESGLSIVVTLSPEVKTRHIPPLALQILVENAIKHNIVSFTHPLYIQIYEEGNYLVVSNNRQSRRRGYNPIQNGPGIGLKNLEERYRLIADKAIVVSGNEENFVVKIPMI